MFSGNSLFTAFQVRSAGWNWTALDRFTTCLPYLSRLPEKFVLYDKCFANGKRNTPAKPVKRIEEDTHEKTGISDGGYDDVHPASGWL